MKRILLSILVTLICCTTAMSYIQQRETRFARLTEQFNSPSKEFRSAPLWVWNTNVTRKDIDRMLQELKEQGFGGAFIHPRAGLENDYLSDEWFDLWEYSLKKGEELGMDIWIYDENSYPSGFAGGHVQDEMPESYNQGQALIGQRSSQAPKPDDCYLCVLRNGDEYTDITAQLEQYQGKKGDYYIYRLGYNGNSIWTAGFPYVDLMLPGVTDKFIDITMRRGYERRFGNLLGTKIQGTFTDEPQIMCEMGGHCRWTPALFDTFQKLWGYDLRPHWPQLGDEVGNWRKVRHDYNATLLHLFIENWSMPWHNYCQSKGLAWTGHYWEHNWPDLGTGPDNMAMYAWHDIPAIDMLFNQYNDNDACQAQFGNVRAVKELRSVANQKGYVRTLSETYGGGGWDLRFEDMKRLGDWEYALGVNFMNQHLCHMSITGVRKLDYPPVFTSLSPWWQDYEPLNTYFARLSLVLSQGEQLNDWLILEPTTSLWMHYTNVAGGDPLWKIANAFQHFVTELEKNQVEYDLGSEDMIRRSGSVSPKAFHVDKRAYSTVILPPEITNLENSTFQLLKQFASEGGRIIALGSPTYLDGEENAELKNFIQGNSVTILKDIQQLMALYTSESTLQLEQQGGNHIYHYRSTYEDGQALFVVNSSLTEHSKVNASLPGKYLYRLDAMTGKVYLQRDITKSKGRVQFSANLYPAGSMLYFATNKKLPGAETEKQLIGGDRHEIPAQGLVEIKPVRMNALNLDFCHLTIEGQRHENLFHKAANDKLWNEFEGIDPWETGIQYRTTFLDRDTFTRGNIIMEYPFEIGETFDQEGMFMTIEKPFLWEVSINGTPLNEYTEDSTLDHRCGNYKIGALVRRGSNVIRLSSKRMTIRTEIGPIILRGHFGLEEAPKGFVLTKPNRLHLGNYALQGYQEYPWEMAYSHTYEVKDKTQPHLVRLGKWNGTVAEVWVNGQKAGNIAYPPYELEVTDYLQNGSNKVEVRVIGSLANLYGPHYSKTNGIMGPWNWNGVREQLPGARYNTFKYGLEEDFRLMY